VTLLGNGSRLAIAKKEPSCAFDNVAKSELLENAGSTLFGLPRMGSSTCSH
jgi:hypothetical protein